MLLIQQTYLRIVVLIFCAILGVYISLTLLSDSCTVPPSILIHLEDSEVETSHESRRTRLVHQTPSSHTREPHERQNKRYPSILSEAQVETLHSNTINTLLTAPVPTYLETYKNPCWLEKINKDIRLNCLPYFFLAGFPKCATTDVFYKLTAHAQIVSRRRKEIHFWNKDIWNGSTVGNYLNSLAANTEGIDEGCTNSSSRTPCKLIMGDGTPGVVLTNRLLWKNFSRNRHLLEPRYISADFVHHLLPDTKIIINVRDPVERLYSEYYHHAFHQTDPVGFHKAAKRGVELFRECLTKNFIRTCVYDGRLDIHLSGAYIQKGLYYIYLLDWLKRYRKEQIHVVMFEDYVANQSSVLTDLTRFLEIADFRPDQLEDLAEQVVWNSRKDYWKMYGDMLPDTRRLLQDFYRPYNRELMKLLQRPAKYWRY